MESTLTVLSAAMLALVWATASSTKILDRAGTASVLAQMGLPGVLAVSVSVALPGLEGVLAVSLLFPRTREHAAWASLVLLLTFSIVISVSLIRHHAIACHCFGPLSMATISWRTILRNIGLGVLSLFIIIGTQRFPSLPVHVNVVLQGLTVLAVGTAITCFLVFRERVKQPPRPAASLFDMLTAGREDKQHGGQGRSPETVELGLDDALTTGVLMLSAGCTPCRDIINFRLASWTNNYHDRFPLIVVLETNSVTYGTVIEMEALEWPTIRIVRNGTLRQFGIELTPAMAVLQKGDYKFSEPHYGLAKVESAVALLRDQSPLPGDTRLYGSSNR